MSILAAHWPGLEHLIPGEQPQPHADGEEQLTEHNENWAQEDEDNNKAFETVEQDKLEHHELGH